MNPTTNHKTTMKSPAIRLMNLILAPFTLRTERIIEAMCLRAELGLVAEVPLAN